MTLRDIGRHSLSLQNHLEDYFSLGSISEKALRSTILHQNPRQHIGSCAKDATSNPDDNSNRMPKLDIAPSDERSKKLQLFITPSIPCG